MTNLTKPQVQLLTAVAAEENGVIPGVDVDRRVVTTLIKRGYCISLPSADGPSQLLVTEAGRAAIGSREPMPAAASPAPQPDATPQPPAQALAEAARPSAPSGKLGELVNLLRRPQGAGIAELAAATGWQVHSVRGAMSGALKKKRGLTITSEKTEAGRVYRVAPDDGR